MPPERPQGWLDRITTSIRRHETDRREARSSLARYEIQAEIGRGGMGVVHRAWDARLGREVALKVLSEEAGSSAEARERFLREAEVAARLTHPNIIPVYDIGDSEGRVFFAMQLVDGSRLDRARLELRAALAALRDAARAVQYAHEKGIVHRDLKPSNLMVDRQGTVFVMDFGLARRSNAAAQLTLTGRILGTPSYMPPEQARGLATDARSDVYSLGATMYEVLSGKPPFEGPNELQILKSVLLDEPLSPRRHNPAIPPDVEAIILKAMDKKPAGRYGSAAALAEDIDRYLKGEPVLAPTRGTFYRLRKKILRHRWRITAAASLALLLASGAVFAAVYYRAYRTCQNALREPDPARRRELLRKAAPLIAAAQAELDRIDREEARRREEEARRAEEAMKDWERERSAGEREKSELESLVKEFSKLVLNRDPVAARATLDVIRGKDRGRAQELESRLLVLEFDVELAHLERLSKVGTPEAFEAQYGRLDQMSQGRKADSIPSLRSMASRMMKNLDYAGAIRWLSEAHGLGCREWELFEQRALAFIEIEEWDRAYQDFIEFRDRRPALRRLDRRFARLYVHRGHQALDRKAWDDALDDLNRAVEIDPSNPDALHDRGRARYRAKGLYAEALADLQEALRHQPNLKPHPDYAGAAVKFARGKAEASWKLESPDERKKAWSESILWLDLLIPRIDGTNPSLLIERARMKRRLGQLEAALEDARKAGEDPEAALLRGQLGYVLAWKGAVPDRKRLEESLAEMEKSSPDPNYWKFTIRLALASPDLSSIEDRRRGVPPPDSRHLGYQLAALLANMGFEPPRLEMLKEAIDLTDKALQAPIELSEDDYIASLSEMDGLSYGQAVLRFERNARLVRAKAHYGMKEFPSAVRECNRAIELDGNCVKAFFWRGASQYRLDDLDSAERDFRKVTGISRDEKEIQEALGGLDLISRKRKSRESP